MSYQELLGEIVFCFFFIQNGLNTLFKIKKKKNAQALMEDINLGPVRTWPIFVSFAKIFVIRPILQVSTVSIFISKFCQAVQTFKSAVLPLVPYALG